MCKQDEPEIRKRVKIAVGLLVGSKVLNVGVPFIFKHAIDTLNAHSIAAGGEAVLSMGTAPEAVTAAATSILLGCENIQMYLNNILRETNEATGSDEINR